MVFGNLPHSLLVQGEAVEIKTDFRVWINFILDFNSSDELKKFDALKSVFAKNIIFTQENTQEIIQQIFLFLENAKSFCNEQEKEIDITKKQEKAYDYKIDVNYIYSAFMQQYRIDLYSVDLHYYQFIALFDSLGEQTFFRQIAGFRVRDIRKIKDKEEKKHAQKMKKIFALPEDDNIKKTREEFQKHALDKWGL